jgi:hypothetical protein
MKNKKEGNHPLLRQINPNIIVEMFNHFDILTYTGVADQSCFLVFND